MHDLPLFPLAQVALPHELTPGPFMAFGARAAAYGCMAMLMALTPVALAHHGHGLSQILLAVGLHVVAMYGLSVPLGRLADTLGRGAVLVGLMSVANVELQLGVEHRWGDRQERGADPC